MLEEPCAVQNARVNVKRGCFLVANGRHPKCKLFMIHILVIEALFPLCGTAIFMNNH